MSGTISSSHVIFRASPGMGVLEDQPRREPLAAEFPHLAFGGGNRTSELPSLALAVERWESHFFNFYELDAQLDALAESQDGPFALHLVGGDEERGHAWRGILTRCQRWMDRRNDASGGG